MTVKKLINELLEYSMDSEVNVLANIGNNFLKSIDVESGEEISTWFDINSVDSIEFSNGRVDVEIRIEV